ncbi:uncharacterized protein CLUP02_12195 [Colletotrichum lupini]|uniref:Uncharacterized protein n=1 Tax=Colletotrichum lupini TaxID=145971 RepID=A0A9Q8WK83_9PEZI|nr:uncharacterized protein CLUP02_12195 [Colletotrichum lupini]UQC86693.1 hypothetical protein CLUP02_12195 [Colletotrichum lupini]
MPGEVPTSNSNSKRQAGTARIAWYSVHLGPPSIQYLIGSHTWDAAACTPPCSPTLVKLWLSKLSTPKRRSCC